MKVRHIFPIIAVPILVTSCWDKPDKPTPSPADAVERVVMLYAVNHNNLSNDFITNRDQIYSIASMISSSTDKVLVYSYTNSLTPAALYELTLDQSGRGKLSEVKKYGESYDKDTRPQSVSYARMRDVMGDMIARYPNAARTLFFWGHGLGPINPNKYTTAPVYSSPAAERSVETGVPYGFGGEYYPDPVRPAINAMEYMDLDSLAMAIPDGKINTIWFDCCYMGNIEVAYQLRNKCRWMVGYPTEIWGDGLPYDKVLPFVAKSSQDLSGGAKTLFDYYNNRGEAVTVGVYDMKGIEQVAQMARSVVKKGTDYPSTTGLQNYSRMLIKYYDFGQLIEEYIKLNYAADPTAMEAQLQGWRSTMKNFVVYGAVSPRDFNGSSFSDDKYSGVSCYFYQNGNTQRDAFYRRLDFYKTVYK